MLNLEWLYSQSEINWKELSDLCKVAPFGNKSLEYLEKALSNSMFKCELSAKSLRCH